MGPGPIVVVSGAIVVVTGGIVVSPGGTTVVVTSGIGSTGGNVGAIVVCPGGSVVVVIPGGIVADGQVTDGCIVRSNPGGQSTH